MQELVLASRNPSKIAQIKDIFSACPDITTLSLEEARIVGDVVEDGETLTENALKKARFAYAQSAGRCVAAEDTGIFIEALRGFPGVHAATWAGNISTEEIMNATLRRMYDVPKGERNAEFRTLVVLVWGEETGMVFEGSIPGKILSEPRCAPHPKMPYSSIFVPDWDKKGRTWAEMTMEEENKISHRGQAWRRLRDHLGGMFAARKAAGR